MRVSSRAPQESAGISLVAYLAGRFTYLGVEQWQELVENGRIWLNGRSATTTSLVHGGDLITCDLPEFPEPEVNLAYDIVYEDEWLLGINKPAGLRVHSQGKFVTTNLIYHLRHRRQPPYPEALLVNRLDANTSGVVLAARSPAVKQALDTQFAAGSVEKLYHALVLGSPKPPSGVIDLPLGPAPGSDLAHRQGVVPGGKTAVTLYKTVAVYQGGFSLLELRPKTGRTHQLRAHLAALGYPIVGDALYSLDDEAYRRWLANPQPLHGLSRQALHCSQTSFTHPVAGQLCTIAAPLPEDIQRLLARLL